ncbi:MAG: hypothetical protein IPO08_23780 [Xanthomonadales bacterium]|nr:hypothetical protein [Xanthomonadales bacterium]
MAGQIVTIEEQIKKIQAEHPGKSAEWAEGYQQGSAQLMRPTKSIITMYSQDQAEGFNAGYGQDVMRYVAPNFD